MSGLLITFEGTDGCGKTTQIELLKDYLEEQGYDCLVTREPGGTEISEQIRHILLDINNKRMGNVTEMLLYAAARAQLVEEVIQPALLVGRTVLCDRFVDSSAVYQGIGRGLGTDAVYDVNSYALHGVKPDMTFYMELSYEEGLKRKSMENTLDRVESEDDSFHRMVTEGYEKIFDPAGSRCSDGSVVRIDASLPVDTIHSQIVGAVNKFIG